MKKTLIVFAAACALCMGLLVACGSSAASSSVSSAESDSASSASTSASAGGDGKLSVVCTIFPAYDWAREVIGDNADGVELTLLLDDGVDLHSYQPTVADIATISECDVFVYVGGESDEWVDDALADAVNPDMKVVNLLESVGSAAVEEEVVEGMQGEEEEEGEEGEGEEGPEYDEHVWLSLRNAQTLVSAIADAIGAADPANADAYAANAKAYNAKLAELDAQYADAVKAGSFDTVVFADRFPFRYLVDDYGLNYYAAFVGCSAETEASFETIAFLAQKVDELGLGNVLVIESSDGKIAATVIENTASKDQGVLTMDSLQSTTADDVAAGMTYLTAMQDNLDVLKAALA